MKNNNKFYFKKSFGQNFLINEEILMNIVDFANIDENSYVLEIGAGSGNLTKYLSKKAKQVISVEIDKTLIQNLFDKFKSSNVFILNADFLKLDENDFLSILNDLNINKDTKLSVCANIPYNITSLIIKKLLDTKLFDNITLMIQKEVADRILAKVNTKNYGILTLTTSLYANVTEGFTVGKENFYPMPKVDSKVIRLNKKQIDFDKNFTDKLFKVIKACFNERRKTLVNSLSHNLHIDKKDILDALDKLNINENARAENLSLDNYISLNSIITHF